MHLLNDIKLQRRSPEAKTDFPQLRSVPLTIAGEKGEERGERREERGERIKELRGEIKDRREGYLRVVLAVLARWFGLSGRHHPIAVETLGESVKVL